jgi:hypothetical protein
MSTPPACACTCTTADSALSLTANAISIVTLAYVLLAGILYRAVVHQRAKDSSSTIRADAATLRRKIVLARENQNAIAKAEKELLESQTHDGAVTWEAEVARNSPLDNADLRRVEYVLEAASGAPNSSDERWYQIWRQLYYARKRSDLTQRLARVQATLEFHANYQ